LFFFKLPWCDFESPDSAALGDGARVALGAQTPLLDSLEVLQLGRSGGMGATGSAG